MFVDVRPIIYQIIERFGEDYLNRLFQRNYFDIQRIVVFNDVKWVCN